MVSTSPGSAISSLGEWNREYGTSYAESDFNVPTPVYDCNSDLKNLMDELSPHAYRTHFLRLPSVVISHHTVIAEDLDHNRLD